MTEIGSHFLPAPLLALFPHCLSEVSRVPCRQWFLTSVIQWKQCMTLVSPQIRMKFSSYANFAQEDSLQVSENVSDDRSHFKWKTPKKTRVQNDEKNWTKLVINWRYVQENLWPYLHATWMCLRYRQEVEYKRTFKQFVSIVLIKCMYLHHIHNGVAM